MYPKTELETPCLVLDRKKLVNNLATMQTRAAPKQVRPHVKTHKCSTLAKLQIEAGCIGISAAKISEAEVLVEQKISGVLITSPVVATNKIARVMTILQKDPSLTLVVDSRDNVRELNDAAKRAGKTLNVLVDIDPGVNRTGVSYSDAVPFAAFVHNCSHLRLQGIQCYAGNLQHITKHGERREKTLTAMQLAAEQFRAFHENRLPCHILTGSGTGTYEDDVEIAEVTEVQPGSYTVMDMEYNNIEAEYHYLNALTLLTTVISTNHASHVTVDAGTKALYLDQHTNPKITSHPNLNYTWGGFGDEHGKITTEKNGSLPSVKTVLELIVPHCDPTINLYDQFYITEDDQVVDTWPIDMRGKSQ